MRSRTFLHVSLGILALAAAYHLGARSATAQATGNPVVAFAPYGGGSAVALAVTAGDVYETNSTAGPWFLGSNVFSGGATPVRQESMGAVKARYR